MATENSSIYLPRDSPIFIFATTLEEKLFMGYRNWEGADNKRQMH